MFCASLADVFEDRTELDVPRRRLFATIAATPHLDWLLLTKRPENARALLTDDEWRHSTMCFSWGADLGNDLISPEWWPLPNVWLGVTAEDQEQANLRIPILLDTPATVRFVSYEPGLGHVDFTPWLGGCDCGVGNLIGMVGGQHHEWCTAYEPVLDWVIVGGESGPHARPFDIQWARDTVTQCQAAGVPVFVKQLGRHPYYSDGIALGGRPNRIYMHQEDKKGGDVSEWPADLRVQEFPP